MALIKEKELESGVVYNYWKIKSVSLIYISSSLAEATIITSGYLNKTSRISGKVPVGEMTFNNIKIDIESGRLLKVCYDALKQTAEFSNAGDDL